MEKKIYTLDDLKQVDDDKLRAAYALNMCTVSVSQIIDCNDVYILEQEYEAILNNLNLEVIPKDEALLKTIMELLNTITFFRIQDIKKAQLEKEYQQRVKNAIWSAVPTPTTFGIIPNNNIGTVISLAVQVGTSYMNYRREKNDALSDKEKAEVELQITAIEQLNALRRELFTAAWRLADKYDYPDCLRLTEKQIKQYDEILMDSDEFRKYARLEAIQKNFFGYPPFWYHFAHTALYIATSAKDSQIKATYLGKAKQHFNDYYEINRFNMFREDQLTASANLEYIDLLLLDEKPDKDKINMLIDETVEKAGTSKDILQLCSVAYLRTDNQDAASRLLKILVNEDYNAVTNAKILSRLYVAKYVGKANSEDRANVYSDYEILKSRTEPLYLFPMPADPAIENVTDDFENRFIKTQINLLQKMYRNSLDAYAKKTNIEFNAVIPAPYNIRNNRSQYFDHTIKSKEIRMRDAYSAFHGTDASNYVSLLHGRGIKYGFIDVLNETIKGLEDLVCFKNLINHDDLILIIERKLKNSKVGLVSAQEKLNSGTFRFEDYQNLVEKYSFQYYTKDFFTLLKEKIVKSIEDAKDMRELEKWDIDLNNFCNKHKLPAPESYIHTFKGKSITDTVLSDGTFFNYELLGESELNQKFNTKAQVMTKYLKEALPPVIPENNVKVGVYFKEDAEFKEYWDSRKLTIPDDTVYSLRKKVIAIIKDNTPRGFDLILCVDGARLVSKNRIGECVAYENITFNANKGKLEFGYIDTTEYSNKNIKIGTLKGILEKLKDM